MRTTQHRACSAPKGVNIGRQRRAIDSHIPVTTKIMQLLSIQSLGPGEAMIRDQENFVGIALRKSASPRRNLLLHTRLSGFTTTA